MFVMLREIEQYASSDQMQHHVENQQALARTALGSYYKTSFFNTRSMQFSELNTRERKGQDATKITSVPTESCIQFLW